MARRAGIRDFCDGDAPAVAALLRAAAPYYVVTAELLLHELRSAPARAGMRFLAAVEDGRVVGFGQAGLDWRAADLGIGSVWTAVAPDARRRGIGSALAEAAVEHAAALGAHTLSTFADPARSRSRSARTSAAAARSSCGRSTRGRRTSPPSSRLPGL